MAIPSGVASTRTLTDIANAIRYKNGENWRYQPGQMADKVAALSGDDEGGGMQYPYDDTVLAGKMMVLPYTSIANAIRGQNGETKDYKPSEMTDAIRALNWDTPKAYAVAISSSIDETKYELHFNRATTIPSVGDDYSGKTIAYVYTDFEDKIYTSNSQVPWYPQHDQFTHVSFDSTVKPKTCAYMFYLFTSCTVFNFAGLDTSEAVSFAYMFYSCSAIKYINLGWKTTSNVKSMKYMFYNCTQLATIYVNYWDVSNVESFQECFRSCTSLTVINGLTTWNISSTCTNVLHMFSNCSGTIRLELGQWDLSGVQSIANMFSYMSNIQSIV